MRKRAVIFAAVVWLMAAGFTGCGVPEEKLTAREAAIALFESGDYEGAIAAIEELLADADRVGNFETDLLQYRAEAEYRVRDFTASVYTCEILRQIDEDKAEYRYLAAAGLAEAGDPDGAEEELAGAKALDPAGVKPGYTEAIRALAAAYEEAGKEEKAKAVYEGLLAEGKGTPAMYAAYSKLLIANAEYEEALAVIDGGLSSIMPSADSSGLKSDTAGTADTAPSAESLTLSDEAEAARRDLYFNQAVCREYLGDYAEALELFQSYLDRYGADEAAEHEIAFLQTR